MSKKPDYQTKKFRFWYAIKPRCKGEIFAILPMVAERRVSRNFCRTTFPADMRTKVRSYETNKFSANLFDTKLKRNTHMFGVTKCWGHHKFHKEPSWDHHLKKRLLCLINIHCIINVLKMKKV